MDIHLADCNFQHVGFYYVGIFHTIMDPKVFFQSKITTILLASMLVLIMIVTARLLLQKREVDREIQKLQSQANEVQKSNQQLSELIKYLNTPEYAEKEAREKLNLRKEGEHVVVLPKDSDEQVAGANVADQSNPKLWFNYFFGNK